MNTLRATPVSAICLLLSSAALGACSGDGQDETTVAHPLDAAAMADIEAKAERLVAAGVSGVSVAVISGDQTVLVTRGVADRETNEPMSAAHRFRVASLAKSIVASLILQLVDEGELTLSDTVEDWLPGMLPENSDSSIENLLRLQSGIFSYDEDERHMAPYLAGDLGYTYQPEQLIALAAEHPAMFRPGEQFYYSNTNYTLLALIVQKIVGRPLADVARERIFEPVGMSSSSMPITSALESPYSHGYMLGFGPEPLDATGISASSIFGNGNLVATPLDTAMFYGALVRGEVVSEALLPAMFRLDPKVPDTHYAMGLWHSFGPLIPCGAFIGHDGADPGYDGTSFSKLDGTRQYAVWTNSLAPGDVVGDRAAQQAYKELVVAAACN
jgi:D-alanyl-D-alanine carboxypeptidase